MSKDYASHKLLLAISSWPFGNHQAARDTFLKQAEGLDYRFFLGNGTPIDEHEQEIDQAWKEGLIRYPHYHNHPDCSSPFGYDGRPDEVMLPAPWDFKHLSLKVREIFRWAHARDYSHVFKCDTDTYVDIPRLLACGWEQQDYMGYPFHDGELALASGGAGYIVSRHSFGILKDAPVLTPFEDVWVARTLRDHGIRLHEDHRFRVNSQHEFSTGPRPDNDSITSHLGFSPEPYDPRDMYLAHRLRQA